MHFEIYLHLYTAVHARTVVGFVPRIFDNSLRNVSTRTHIHMYVYPLQQYVAFRWPSAGRPSFLSYAVCVNAIQLRGARTNDPTRKRSHSNRINVVLTINVELVRRGRGRR